MAIDNDYWDKYYRFWDDFVRGWYDYLKKDKTCAEQIAIAYGKASSLNIDELPTPYLGVPNRDGNLKAVFLNLNPGMSEKVNGVNLDESQYYSNIDNGDHGWMIKKFRDEESCKYSSFIRNWSCLNPPNDPPHPICGVRWWRDRMEWVRQIYNNSEIMPSEVFALELCPFHSKSWDFNVRESGSLVDFILEHSIFPALKATQERNLPFSIAVGASFNDVFERAKEKGMNLQVEKEWSYHNASHAERQESNQTEIFSDAVLRYFWPRTAKGGTKFTERNYRLYKVQTSDCCARILVTWASGGNKPPASDFQSVEKQIRTFVTNNPL